MSRSIRPPDSIPEMVEIISKRYVALTETENAKPRGCTPDYLRSVLRKPDDNLKKSSIAAGRKTPTWC